jgi:hypothetical protein
MRATAPEIRANWTRILLDHYERRLPAEARAAVDAALAPERRARLERAGPLEWLPADVHMTILPAPLAVLGREAYRSFWRRLMIESYDLPLFRSFVQGAVSVFGTLPAQIFRVVPRGFGLIARGCGEFRVQVAANQRVVALTWDGVPEPLRRDDAFAVAWAGTLESVLDLTSTHGRVTLTVKSPSVVEYAVELRGRAR